MGEGISRREVLRLSAGGIAAALIGCQTVAGRKYEQALALFDAGDYRGSVKLLDEVIATDPLPQVYTSRGAAYAKIGDFDKAIDDFGAAIRLNGEFADAFRNKGRVYHQKAMLSRARGGEIEAQALLEQAVQDFGFAVRYAPEDPRGHAFLGLSLKELGEETKAFNALEAAVKRIDEERGRLPQEQKPKGVQDIPAWEVETRQLYLRLRPKYRQAI
jgi:tetratricopeptide (TPR) repeat protein